MKTYIIVVLLWVFSPAISFALPERQSIISHQYSEKEKIELLIKSIENLQDAKFDRNGSVHTSKEAANHLRGKYKNHEKYIKTAKDFIEKIASKSGMSGKPYYIIYSNGTKVTASEFLNKKLNELEKAG